MKTTGYFKEYYLGTKYMGRKECEKDRNQIGYMGKTKHIADTDIKLKRKKITKGQEYFTILYPYNGEKS